MLRGTVKWFDDGKGYGFIEQEEGPDAFVHFTAIEQEARGRRFLLDGDRVEYDVQKTDRGVQATRVKKIPS